MSVIAEQIKLAISYYTMLFLLWLEYSGRFLGIETIWKCEEPVRRCRGTDGLTATGRVDDSIDLRDAIQAPSGR